MKQIRQLLLIGLLHVMVVVSLFPKTPGLVFVRVPVSAEPEGGSSLTGLPGDRYVAGCGIMKLESAEPGAPAKLLTSGFYSALDPSISFDGQSMLFTAKKTAGDHWRIWQADLNGGNLKPVTGAGTDAVSPLYIGSIFHLDDTAPTRKIAYVSGGHLYTSNLDGSGSTRISFNTSPEFSPDVLPNGRIVYSTTAGPGGRLELLAINIDGTDHMGYLTGDMVAGDKEMVRMGRDGRVYFIISDVSRWLGGGKAAAVEMRRPAHSLRYLDPLREGYYHSPCPLPGGGTVLSYREAKPGSLYGLYRLGDGPTPQRAKLYDTSGYHCIDAHVITPRPVVKGRSSFVEHSMETGVLYCINVYISREVAVNVLTPGSVASVQVTASGPAGKKILGSAPVEKDGSFHIRVPARTPLTFQLKDKTGRTLARQVSHTWVLPRESRGCIGCHEDSELAPPNQLPEAVTRPTVPLAKEPAKTKQKPGQHK